MSKQLKVGDRSAIFGHLAAYLPCSKDTLLKRAKTLRAKELENKIKEPLDKLKRGLDDFLVSIFSLYVVKLLHQHHA